MRLKLEVGTPKDAAAVAALRVAVAQDLTSRHGTGPWSSHGTEKGVLFDMRQSTVYVARKGERIVGTFVLATKKPWAIDRKYFKPCARPLYLLSMSVEPGLQRKGIGRRCIEAAIKACKKFPAQAIWLDAYDSEAGAGDFYRKCGFEEVGHAAYRNVPLIYFEMVMPTSATKSD